MRTLILAMIAFTTLQATAQDQRHRDKEARKARSERMKDLSAEDIAELQSKKMTLHLDLSEKQQAQVKDIIYDQATLRIQKREAREKMKEEGKEKLSKEEHVKMMNERLDEQIEMKKKMKSILTTEQYEKWEKAFNKKHRGKHKRKTRE